METRPDPGLQGDSIEGVIRSHTESVEAITIEQKKFSTCKDAVTAAVDALPIGLWAFVRVGTSVAWRLAARDLI